MSALGLKSGPQTVKPMATIVCAHEDERRGSSTHTNPTIKEAALPTKMSQTLAGIGGSVDIAGQKASQSSHSDPSPSVDDDCSDYIGARSYSQSSLLSEESVVTSVFDDAFITLPNIANEPQGYVIADAGPHPVLLSHHRDRARVETWPLPTRSSSQLTFPHRQVFETANAIMAQAQNNLKRGEDQRRTLLPIRKGPCIRSSPLSQESPITDSAASPEDSDVLSNEDRYLPDKRKANVSLHQTVLSNGHQAALEAVLTGPGVQEMLEDSVSMTHASQNSSRNPKDASTTLEDGQVFDEHDEAANDEQQDDPYEKLASDIRDLVMMSAFGSHLEELNVPIDNHVFACLERMLNRNQGGADTGALESSPNELAQNPSTGNYIPIAPGQASSEGNSGSRKRKTERDHRRRRGQDDDEGADSDEEGLRDAGPVQRHVKEIKSGRLSCPFRKKNSLRFNVRDHNQCATQCYADIFLLKRHINSTHFNKSGGTHQCLRCKLWFETEDVRNEHLMQGQACAIQEDQVTRDQEHGITQKTRDLLAERKSGIKIVTWEKLWEVLFPDVPCPSSDFEPPMELEEVAEIFLSKQNVVDFNNRLTQTQSSSTPHAIFYESQKFVTENLERCHEMRGHCRSEQRDNEIKSFLHHVGTIQHSFTQAQIHRQSCLKVLAAPPELGQNSYCNTAGNISDESSQIETVISSSEGEAQPSSLSSTSPTHNNMKAVQHSSSDHSPMGPTTQYDGGTVQYGLFHDKGDVPGALHPSEYIPDQHGIEMQQKFCIFCRGQGCPNGCPFWGVSDGTDAVLESIAQVNNNFPNDT